jgi:hypothetical protein
MLDGKRLVDLEPELGLVGLVISDMSLSEVGSGRKQRDATWCFQGAIDCTHAVQLLLNGMVDYVKKSIMN